MVNKRRFCQRLAQLRLTHAERAIALLWYYRQTQEFEERTAAELADDLRDAGFPRPNVTRLHKDLTRSRSTVHGKRAKTFQLNVGHVPQLDERYGPLLEIRTVEVSDTVLPHEFVAGTRQYLEKLVLQINGTYDFGFYDACAVLCRRLMESLIIEVFVSKGLQDEIRQDGGFLPLDILIGRIRNHGQIILARNTGKAMEDIKQIGDTAAHDRTYITTRQDLDDTKLAFRRTIKELLGLAAISSQ